MSTPLHDQSQRRANRNVHAVAARCQICGRAVACGRPVCFCCQLSARQLGLPLVPTIVTTEYRVGDRVHARLRGYKDGRTSDERLRYQRVVVGELARWMAVHGDSVADRLGPWSVVTAVPSTRRPGRPPAAALLAGVPGLAERQVEFLERGAVLPRHLDAQREGFAVRSEVDRAGFCGASVLVFDDSVTTGARSQSASAALRLAGLRVVGVLAVGRALAAGVPHGSGRSTRSAHR